MTHLSPRRLILVILALAVPATAFAQTTSSQTAPVAASAPTGQAVSAEPDPDLQLVPGEPDFTLSALPTTLRLPSGKLAFRMTHRFSLAVNSSTAGDFFRNFFNLDSSAQIGFEVRYGLATGTQVSVHRTNERTIQFMGQHEIAAQGATGALSVDVLAAVEGRENFSERFATTIGAVLSRRFGTRGALYFEPMAVLNAIPPGGGGPRSSGMLGIGARIRIGGRTYVTAEAAPRLTAGYHAGVDHVTFGLEKRAGGHVFQLNISNDLGTTFGQLARGGPFSGKWYIGFNLTRKFY